MAYTVTPPELIELGAQALAGHWPGWDHEADLSVDPPQDVRYWPDRANVAREVIRALIDAGYRIERKGRPC